MKKSPTKRGRGTSLRERLVASAQDAGLRLFRVTFADGAPVFDVRVHLDPVPGYILLIDGDLAGEGSFRLHGLWDRAAAEELVTSVLRSNYPGARVEFRGTAPRSRRSRAA